MMEPSVTFWGAARAVTGSMHLVEAGGRRILLDCGLSRGTHAEATTPGIPFEAASIDAVVLTHAHVDHCGALPALVRCGFDGPIYCTAATRDLSAVMLADSARIQEERALLAYAGGRGGPGDTPFSRANVDQTVDQCVPLEYDRPAMVEDVELRLFDAGHLLGSAMVFLSIPIGGRTATLTYTGDLGRRDVPFHGRPVPIPPADLLVCESTYGSRLHDPFPETARRLSEIVRTTIDRDGRVLIPAFSLGRTQLVLNTLQAALANGDIPPVDVFVDSPLAADVTAVYRKYADGDESFLGGPHIRYVGGRDESLALAERSAPYVVIAASGMCEAGRIVHHLRRAVDDPRASVVLVSYQAPHTAGHRLKERGPTVQIGRQVFNKWCDVHYLNGFSGHADRGDFLDLLKPLAGRTGKVRLVHGEPESAESLAEGLREIGLTDAGVPGRGDRETF
jgi:metallo-beta-lactamase family protein